MSRSPAVLECGGFTTVLPQDGLVLAFAAVATTVAVWQLRRAHRT